MSENPSSRITKLNGFFNAVLIGKRTVTTRQEGNLFLEAICVQSDASICIERIILKDPGIPAVNKCVRFDVSVEFFNSNASNLLTYLRSPDVKNLVGGSYLQQIVVGIVEPPTFWSPFAQAFKAGKLNDKAQEGFAWLLLQLLSLPRDAISEDVFEGFKTTANDSTIQKRLKDAPAKEVREHGYKIAKILETFKPSAAGKLAGTVTDSDGFGPGGRHDNDFADIQKIAILPTADELTSTELPFMRTASDLETSKDTYRSRLSNHIDNQFRLNREDMLSDIREELQIALNIRKGRKRRGFMLKSLRLEGIDCGTDNRREAWGLRLKLPGPFPGLERYKDDKARRRYLGDHKGIFKHQSLSCLLADGQIVGFPTIHRDEDLLAKNPGSIILRFTDEKVIHKTLLQIKCSQDISLIQINTSVFAFEPILNRLKDIKQMELSEELLHWKPGVPVPDTTLSITEKVLLDRISAAPSSDLKNFLKTAKSVKLDQSQAQCFLSGVKQRVSLIQGPPGTGKSFVGALITKAIYEKSKKNIVVVCYTNHALDQFLEDLMDVGIPTCSMLRLGGKSTARTKQLALFEKKQEMKTSQGTWLNIKKTTSQLSDMEDRLEAAFGRYKNGGVQKSDIMEHIEFLDGPPFFHNAFQVPSQENGMQIVGQKGKKVSQYYLLDRWAYSHDAGVFKKHPVFKQNKDVWQLLPDERNRLRREWEMEILSDKVQDFASMVKKYNQSYAHLETLRSEKHLDIVRSKRIIGCTTTAAAKYNRELQAANPRTIIVEEAGEILESHILTSLGPKTEQLVLIGDHKQLRPKICNYKLSVEKGEGYNLNVSLFERLVLKGFPHHVLSQQHRMRPEISSLVRALTYENLVDAPSTKNRDDIRGLQSNIVFLSHNQPELDAEQLSDRKDVHTTSSKQNKFEVEMVLKCVKYLAQQGYGTEDIVVLTPYLGQLYLLQRMLSKDNDPVLNDLDSHDLVQAGLMPEESAKLAKKPIYISTIDNYQGEEKKIVVATLTRSNEGCEIGFMSSHERLNVLLSRARDGLILIGNADTFKNSKKGKETWTPFFELMHKDGNVFGGLPVKCERHPNRARILKTPLDFEEECPDGGCLEDCGATLNCKLHKCPSKCHQIADHSKMVCKEIMHSKCPAGHDQTYKCHELLPKSCKQCDKEAERKKKAQQEALERQLKQEREQKEHDREMARINAEIAAQNQRIRDQNLAMERANALQMKQRDLENAIKQATSASLRGTQKSVNVEHISKNVSTGSVSIPVVTTSLNEAPSQQTDTMTNENSTRPTIPIRRRSENGAKSSTPKVEPSPETIPQPKKKSKSVVEWDRQKNLEGANNPDIDTLMGMIGLEQVKAQVLRIKAQVETAQKQGRALKEERFHVSMLGNPGTGKTTVARLYAKILNTFGILNSQTFIETTGSSLGNEGVNGAKKMVEGIINGGGGVILIDEAYQLVESGSFGGKLVLDYLLAEMENNRDKLVFILTGYNKEMEKFFEHNPGLQSRVPYTLQFDDYEDDELKEIFLQMVEKRFKGQMKIEGGSHGLYVRIAIRRLGRGRNSPGFGNARAVQNLFSKITAQQAERIAEERANGNLEDHFLLTKEDLIGPDPSNAVLQSKALTELQRLTGLADVKDAVKSLLNSIKNNYDRELLEKEPMTMTPNKVFVGNPGTGKTTVAKLYGQILKDIGVLSNGEVVVKNPSDFIGSAMGQSESNTKAILSNTVGKVLIIDEAYMLYSNMGSGVGGTQDPYRTAVIDTIVAEVQNVPGEDRCVLLLGYKDKMEEMYQNINPGFKRRFPLEDAFDFKDYNDEDLRKIMEGKLKKKNLQATDKAKDVAIGMLSRGRNRPHFGNAGEVENLISKAVVSMNARISKSTKGAVDDTLQAADFDKDYDRGTNAAENTEKLFKDVVGCEDVVEKLKSYQEISNAMRQRGMDPSTNIPTTFVFKGPPGTGKTTTARLMGQVYYDMGFLAAPEVVECSASDLIAQYVGQTAKQTRETVTKALGKVLFVDEAYRLSDPIGFAKEAIDELVDILTKPQFAGKVIIILAGYDHDMEKLMAVNAGLASRFADEIIFKNMSPTHCLQVLFNRLLKDGIAVHWSLKDPSSKPYQDIIHLLEKMSRIPSWANARDVLTLAKNMNIEVFKTVKSGRLEVSPDLAMKCATAFFARLQSRQPNPALSSQTFPSPKEPNGQFLPPPTLNAPRFKTETSCAKKSEEVKHEPQSEPEASATQGRDVGVTDAVWNQLQKDKDEMLTKDILAKIDLLAKQKKVKEAEKAAAEAEKMEQELARRAHDDEERCRLEKLRLERVKRLAELERARRAAEAAEKARKEARAREAKAQAKLRKLGVCVMGFQWIKQTGGYRCAGGSHFVSDTALGDLSS